MILYDLKCGNGHKFEAWFKDSAAFDEQAKHGDIECPMCSDTNVGKSPMAPRISKSNTAPPAHQKRLRGESRAKEVAREILDAVHNVQKHVEENFENVGDKFADEARAIHYGDAEERGIYGEASDDEANDLIDEDIPVYRLPVRPRKDN